ncbi:MAG TPA: magnesium transporter CorA family protein [Candidatus Saccharimonadales bacterium]|nr:magnesium transporter CorA family protein [Candidatus Saccharimonadales bacterium]
MIKYFYKSLRGNELQEQTKPQRGSWVYVEAPTEKEINQLAEQFDLEAGYLTDAIDEDEMPRLEQENKKSYIFVRYAHATKSGDIDTAPLLVVFTEEYVITVSPEPLPALDALMKGRLASATTQRAKLVLLILSQISDQYDTYINQTSRKIKAIRSRLRGQNITNQDLIDFVTIEDELNEFLASLLPNNATLRRLLVGRHIPLFEEDQDIVEDLLLSNEQSIEAIRSNLRSIANMRDAHSAISSNNLNRVLTILTVATILISVPSIAMGIYSLNIPLPFQTTHWIFWVVMGINVSLISAVLYVARKKRVI